MTIVEDREKRKLAALESIAESLKYFVKYYEKLDVEWADCAAEECEEEDA